MTQQSDSARDLGSPDEPGGLGDLLFENSRVRVWQLVLAPGETCAWHRHDMEHLLIVVDGCSVGAKLADGSTREFDIADGTVLVQSRKDQAEIAWNSSAGRTLRELIVEFKDSPPTETEQATFTFFR
jgi:beta-alanine degradation protein BauB